MSRRLQPARDVLDTRTFDEGRPPPLTQQEPLVGDLIRGRATIAQAHPKAVQRTTERRHPASGSRVRTPSPSLPSLRPQVERDSSHLAIAFWGVLVAAGLVTVRMAGELFIPSEVVFIAVILGGR